MANMDRLSSCSSYWMFVCERSCRMLYSAMWVAIVILTSPKSQMKLNSDNRRHTQSNIQQETLSRLQNTKTLLYDKEVRQETFDDKDLSCCLLRGRGFQMLARKTFWLEELFTPNFISYSHCFLSKKRNWIFFIYRGLPTRMVYLKHDI